MVVLRHIARGAFAVAGLTLLIAGPIASAASDWGVRVAVTIAAAGAVALAIAVVGFKDPQAGG